MLSRSLCDNIFVSHTGGYKICGRQESFLSALGFKSIVISRLHACAQSGFSRKENLTDLIEIRIITIKILQVRIFKTADPCKNVYTSLNGYNLQ